MIFFFSLLIWWIAFIDFWVLNQPCIPAINLSWSLCIVLFTCCWIQFANALRIFFIYVFEWYWYVVFFFYPCDVFVLLWYGDFAGLTRYFLFWKIINFWFNLFYRYSYFNCLLLLVWLLSDNVFQQIGPFHLSFQLSGHEDIYNVPLLFFQFPWDK